ncbi:MAG: hypothetical protein NT018_07810 [Armatimonadetes bacterium]|nr:hypothetical protein [Armatimonadota bacterium]
MSVNIAPAHVKTDSVFRDQSMDLRSSKRMLTQRFRKHWRRNSGGDELPDTLNNESDVRLNKPVRNSCQSRRHTKCTPELTKQFCRYLREIATIERACQLCGIDRKSYYTWMKRGEIESARTEAATMHRWADQVEEPFLDFYASIKYTSAWVEFELVSRVGELAPRWILEHRWPERWGHRAVRKHSGELLGEDHSSETEYTG